MKNSLYLTIMLFFLCLNNICYSQIKVIGGNACVGCEDPENAKLKSQGTSQLEFAIDALVGNADFTYQIIGQTKGQIKYLNDNPGITYNLDNNNTSSGPIPNSKSALFLNSTNLRVGINKLAPSSTLDVNGNINYSGSLTNTSDKRLKENIQSFKIGLHTILHLEPITYNYNGLADLKEEGTHIGITAQNLQDTAPSLVEEWEYIEHAEQTEKEVMDEAPSKIRSIQKYLNINEGAIKYIIINAIKEQQILIEEKDNKIEKLTNLVNSQQKQIQEIQEKLELFDKKLNTKNGL